jgi:hypothetical protein
MRQAIDDDNIIQRMPIACWITKAAHTHTLRICNTYCFSTVTVVTRTLLSVMLYVHCLCCPFLHACYRPYLAHHLDRVIRMILTKIMNDDASNYTIFSSHVISSLLSPNILLGTVLLSTSLKVRPSFTPT